MKSYYEAKYDQGVESKELNPHDEQMKENIKENSHFPCSLICIIVCLLFLIIILLIIIVLTFLYIVKPKYDSEIEILKENNKNLKGEISRETNKLNKMFSRGMIIAWYGEKDKIPEGWTICDGTKGTPDLRNRFIIGSSEKINFGAKGGNSTIRLEKSNLPPIGQSYFSCDSHYGAWHKTSNNFIKFISDYSTVVKFGGPDDWGTNIMIDLNEGMESTPIDIMNPYFSLYYIMKL